MEKAQICLLMEIVILELIHMENLMGVESTSGKVAVSILETSLLE